MRHTRLLVAMLVVGFTGSAARATLVEPPSFAELVTRADLVFAGTVVDVRSEWREMRSGRVIMSAVTFQVLHGFKGNPSPQLVLEFFGGTVGKDTMRIAGMPSFSRGDRDVLFVRRGSTKGIPLVGLMHGRFRITRTPSGLDMVTTHDGRAIGDLSTLHLPARPRREILRGMTWDEFSAAIAQRVSSRPAANR